MVVKRAKVSCFLALLLILAVRSGAQEYNSVSLDHIAYEIIEIGIMRGMIRPPSAIKPWPVHTVKQKLQEMAENSANILSAKELDMVTRTLNSFERKVGFEPRDGRYWAKNGNLSFETGFGWESAFSVESSGALLSSVNMAKIYAGGDLAHFLSWNIAALGGFLYIERKEQGEAPPVTYAIPAIFPYTFSKQWDGGVLSLRDPGTYIGWPDDPSLAYGVEAELNGVFFNEHLHLRLGRLRHDWGSTSGTSLFLNAHARPFAALEGTVSPLSWLHISFLAGGLEQFRDDDYATNDRLFTNMLTAAHIEFNPLKYIYFDIGAAMVVFKEFNSGIFTNFEVRLPGLLSFWASLFVDRVESPFENFFLMAGNSYAYQAGIKALFHWLPFSAFTVSYTKIEPYCYSAFLNGGESLGYYLSPNSDELLVRFESMFFPDLKTHIQFQMIRHGADYGDMAIGGSSRYDAWDNSRSTKYFLMDGVYQWDNIIKLGGSYNFRAVGIPFSLFTEIGLVITRFTINGTAGVGNEANHEPLNNDVYSDRNSFIFSIGFRLFPH